MNFKEKSYCPDKVLLPDYVMVSSFLELINLDINKAYELLTKFDVNKNKKISELSKGMKQKIILTQCISKKADCYLFDEPLNGLDERCINVFKNEILDLYNKNKLIIIVTHQTKIFENLPIKIIDLACENES